MGLLNTLLFLAQQDAAAPAGQFTMQPLFMMGLFMAGMYFVFIAPQRKRQKKHEQMIACLTTGDEVITTSGIYGAITNVKPDRFVLRVADNTKIEIGKGHIHAKTTEKAN